MHCISFFLKPLSVSQLVSLGAAAELAVEQWYVFKSMFDNIYVILQKCKHYSFDTYLYK
jgi:hypothetical protein